MYHHIPRVQGEVDHAVILHILLLALLEDKTDVCFPLVFKHFSHLSQSMKIIKSGLVMTSASSFSNCGCVPSEPVDLGILLRYSQSLTSSTSATSSLFQLFLLVSGTIVCYRHVNTGSGK